MLTNGLSAGDAVHRDCDTEWAPLEDIDIRISAARAASHQGDSLRLARREMIVCNACS